MSDKLKVFSLVLLLVHTIQMEPLEKSTPSMISTTTPISPQEKDNKLLVEELAQMQAIVKINKYRLEILELQNTQMRYMLQKILLLQQTRQLNDTEIDSNKKHLLFKIEAILDEKLNKVRSCDNQIQIFKELEKVKSKIGELEEPIQKCASGKQVNELQNKIFERLDKMSELLNSRDANEVQATKKPDIQANDEELPKNCKEVQQRGNKVTGIYTIKPEASPAPFEVRCNMETHDGGWTYLMSRFDGSQDFYLNWTDYKNGFGSLSGEFWMGLEHLYEMTGSSGNQLLVELSDWEGKKAYAHYKNFQIDSENKNYRLKVLSEYSGDAGNSLAMHVGTDFNTLDHRGTWGHCVRKHKGAWWYTSGCLYSQLTGVYEKQIVTKYATGIHWGNFRGYSYSLKEAAMMIKPSE